MRRSSRLGAPSECTSPAARLHRRSSAPEMRTQVIDTTTGLTPLESDTCLPKRALRPQNPASTIQHRDGWSHESTTAIFSPIPVGPGPGASRYSRDNDYFLSDHSQEERRPTEPSIQPQHSPYVHDCESHDRRLHQSISSSFDSSRTRQRHINGRMTPPTAAERGEHGRLRSMALATAAAKFRMFNTYTRKGRSDAPKTATLNIAAAQRLVIAKLQKDIIDDVSRIYAGEPASAPARDLEYSIPQYCTLRFPDG